jgi:hypothetical protein
MSAAEGSNNTVYTHHGKANNVSQITRLSLLDGGEIPLIRNPRTFCFLRLEIFVAKGVIKPERDGLHQT